MEKNVPNDLNNAAISDVESEDDNEEGDYTVYECPGLAPVSIFFSSNIEILQTNLQYTLYI